MEWENYCIYIYNNKYCIYIGEEYLEKFNYRMRSRGLAVKEFRTESSRLDKEKEFDR